MSNLTKDTSPKVYTVMRITQFEDDHTWHLHGAFSSEKLARREVEECVRRITSYSSTEVGNADELFADDERTIARSAWQNSGDEWALKVELASSSVTEWFVVQRKTVKDTTFEDDHLAEQGVR